MNRWMTDIFSVIFNIINLIAFVIFVIGLVNALSSPETYGFYDRTFATLSVIGLFVLYILFVGVVSTLLSINETLQNIESSLTGGGKAKPNKSPPSMGGGKMSATPDDIWNSPKVGSDDKKKK